MKEGYATNSHSMTFSVYSSLYRIGRMSVCVCVCVGGGGGGGVDVVCVYCFWNNYETTRVMIG